VDFPILRLNVRLTVLTEDGKEESAMVEGAVLDGIVKLGYLQCVMRWIDPYEKA
jgi:hypothetical protein